MAVTKVNYVGDGVTDTYAFSFPYITQDDITVTLDEVVTTAYTFPTASSIQFTSAPGNGVAIQITRITDIDAKIATFSTGAALRAGDLNNNFDQILYSTQELSNSVIEGVLPDGSVTSIKIADGTILNVDINANAGIELSKLEAITPASVVIGNGSGVPTDTALTGDVTINSSGVTSIAAGVVGTTELTDASVTTTKIADSNVTEAKVADSAITDAKIGDNVLTPYVSSINNGPLAGFRNAIINGNFDVWQRGTSSSANGYGSADRWVNNIAGSSCTMSRQAFTLGQTAVPGEPTYFCRMAVTSVAGASNYAVLTQNIESVRTFAGQQVTISFWIKADASKNIAIELGQYFGSGGSPSAKAEGLAISKVAIGTSWQKVTFTATLPSISGKTLGSDNNDFLELVIWFDAGSNFNSRTDSLGQQSGTFDIAQVQIEPGPVATPFERRPIGMELTLCQRYYERCYGNIPSTGVVWIQSFVTPKRVDPSIIIVSYLFGSGGGIAPYGVQNFFTSGYATADARVILAGDAEL